MIRSAISALTTGGSILTSGPNPLLTRNTRVIGQGSYKNNTNVRLHSDVDICVLCTDSFFYDVQQGTTLPPGFPAPAAYTYDKYRQEVGSALWAKFGHSGVTHGSKSVKIHSNTYRVDADVVPCFEYKFVFQDGGSLREHVGVAFKTSGGRLIFNYPEQHYRNGVDKNNRTRRRYKAVVRILKRIRNEMADAHKASAIAVPSFLVECLVWNAHDYCFNSSTYFDNVRSVLALLVTNIRDDTCRDWFEVNGIKYLFRDTQPWTKQQALAFLTDAWSWVGFT